MNFGVNLINFGPGVTPGFLSRMGRLAETLGYHFVMVSDHVANTPDVQAEYPAPFYDPFVTLACLAGSTCEIELGTTVVVLPYRHPLQVASMAENIDRLSGGRFILGIGVGWAKQEFAALGVPFEKRGAMTDDYLAAIRALWSSEVVSHDGPFVSFENVHAAPGRSRSRPPVWVGGSSEAGLRRAVRYGEAWHPINPRLDWLEDKGLPRLTEIAHEEGKPVPSLCPRIRLRLTDSPLDDERLPGEGALDQVYADMRTLESLGAEYLLLDTGPEASLERSCNWLATLADSVLDLKHRRLR